MRLASAELFPIALPYTRSVAWASLTETVSPTLVLRLDAENGATGAGEVTAKAQWAGMPLAAMTAAIEQQFLPILERIGLSDIGAFLEHAGHAGEKSVGRTLVENALWDVQAATSGRPFWSSWGCPPDIPLAWLLTRQAPDIMAREADEMIARYGFTTLKLKGGQGLDTDLAAIRAVRRAAGPDVRIFVDANGSYSAADAPGYLAALAAEGICAVEDPYPLAPDAVFERVQADSSIPIVIDAAGGSLRNAERFCERGAQAIAVKPGIIGLSEARRIAEFASGRACAVHIGVGGESDAGSLAALGAAAALTSPGTWLPSETSFFLLLADRVVAEPLQIVDGNLRRPDAASIAELIDWERVEHLRS